MVFVGPDARIASDGPVGSIASCALVDATGTRLPHRFKKTEGTLDPENGGVGACIYAEAAASNRAIGAQSRPKPHPEIWSTELDGECVVYDPRNGQIHQLNLTATLVWSLCDGDMAVLDIAEAIAGIYGISTDEASLDVHDLLAKFSMAGLVVVSS
jgi:hypothetical protein